MTEEQNQKLRGEAHAAWESILRYVDVGTLLAFGWTRARYVDTWVGNVGGVQ